MASLLTCQPQPAQHEEAQSALQLLVWLLLGCSAQIQDHLQALMRLFQLLFCPTLVTRSGY